MAMLKLPISLSFLGLMLKVQPARRALEDAQAERAQSSSICIYHNNVYLNGKPESDKKWRRNHSPFDALALPGPDAIGD